MLGIFDYLVVVLHRKMTTGLSRDAPENPHSAGTELLSPRPTWLRPEHMAWDSTVQDETLAAYARLAWGRDVKRP
jgi:hypothetical protein